MTWRRLEQHHWALTRDDGSEVARIRARQTQPVALWDVFTLRGQDKADGAGIDAAMAHAERLVKAPNPYQPTEGN
jgi:hypothetical protein